MFGINNFIRIFVKQKFFIYGGNLELIDIVGYSGHAVRGFLSLKSMGLKFRRQRTKQNGDNRFNP